jgi:hypothetical protein
MLLLSFDERSRAAATSVRAFPDAAILLRVWLRQQRLDFGADGVSAFLITALLTHVVESSAGVSMVVLVWVGNGFVRTCASVDATMRAARGALCVVVVRGQGG